MPSAQFTRTPEGLAAVEVLESSTTDETSMTFVFHDEDHTLGNALRHALQRNPNVEFCGYTMPHPSDPKFHLRLQTKGGARAVDVLQEGLESLATMCDELEEVFSEAVPEPER